MTFGQVFKTLRLKKELTQKDLAEDFNKKYNYSFNKSSISQYENDLRKPEIDALKDFADYFNVSIDYLLGKTDNPKDTVTTETKYNELEIPDDVLFKTLQSKYKISESDIKLAIDFIKRSRERDEKGQ